MALKATVITRFGEERELYIRVNSYPELANGLAPRAVALLRGYASRDALEAKWADPDSKIDPTLWEMEVAFAPVIGQPLWPQAYDAAKELPELAGALDV